MDTQVTVDEQEKCLVIKFTLKDEYLEDLVDMLEHHVSRRLTVSEKVQVICELLRSHVEDILSDWTWYLVDATREAISTANDVIAESERGHV